jgi:hypothetical protein
MTNRRFPPPWIIERLLGGFKVIDANGQSLAYFYARENDNDANTAGVLTRRGGWPATSPSCPSCWELFHDLNPPRRNGSRPSRARASARAYRLGVCPRSALRALELNP